MPVHQSNVADPKIAARRFSIQNSLTKRNPLLSPNYERLAEAVRKPMKDGLLHAAMFYRGAYCDLPSPSERGTVTLEKRSHDFTVSETKWKVLELYRAVEFPPVLVCQSLIEAYFDHCWTWMPVMDPSVRDTASTTFLINPTSRKPRSLLLMNAMILAGSRMRKGTKQYV